MGAKAYNATSRTQDILYNFIREEQSLDLIMISRLQARVITSWLAHRITVLLYSEEHAADLTMRLLGQCMLLVFVLVANNKI